MTRILPCLLTALLVALHPTPVGAQARTLDLVFMPPEIEPRDLCLPAEADPAPDDASAGAGDGVLTEAKRIALLAADIRRYQREDAARWFDFIDALIARREVLDEGFAGMPALLARVELYIDAGRLEALEAAGLVPQLRQRLDELSTGRQLTLAQFHLTGIGTPPDPEFAWGVIREAAFAGHPDALMMIARRQLAGEQVPEWDAPLDLTATMAFSGMLGQMNASVCRRAERIAREFDDGGLVAPNPRIAYAWRRFAADMGGRDAAWRVVGHHLGNRGVARDNSLIAHYLEVALERGFRPDADQAARLLASDAIDAPRLRDMLLFAPGGADTRPTLAPLLQLSVSPQGPEPSRASPYLQYLREIAALDAAPGRVFTELAEEVLLRRGRWAGEAEAAALLEEAVRRADPEAMRMLAGFFTRHRDDPDRIDRAVDLLGEAVSRFGLATAMDDLDALFRCRVPDAPQTGPAGHWARAYRAAGTGAVFVNPTDVVALDPFATPDLVARIQSQALEGRTASLANHLQRLQMDPMTTERARRYWADRLDNSEKALEEYAKLEFELATGVGDRRRAIELLRRVYLHNGVTTALDLAIALIESNGRDPQVAAEVEELLTLAGNRGEGAAIRLLARLVADRRPMRQTYAAFAAQIEARGDFLALMFAIPFVEPEVAADYLGRAVALMNCGTKDVVEMADAHAVLNDAEAVLHWQRVGLAMESGNVLAKLRLTDRQMESYRQGRAPDEYEVYTRAALDGDVTAYRQLFRLTANPALETFAPHAAAGYIAALLDAGDEGDLRWVQAQYRDAPDGVRVAVARVVDLRGLYRRAAAAGDVRSMLELGLLLRDTASDGDDLPDSARWLKKAADNGSIPAMRELGQVLAYGIGVPRDRQGAMLWLEKATAAGDEQAARLVRLLGLLSDG
ncbi:hypothetical protein GE300_04260 [Rhodobacteraceae bacterium 2CG4]|uniref:TPR repeat protein n=1 Tax=Halovulum marinum TaxID=2662447 RepID=A0A6L5YYC0_9RHOB|nr:tetratricopeptide repeat protein [Halovulum marinum]MSU88835.1 hypothetical protein [Halovulum marinum]